MDWRNWRVIWPSASSSLDPAAGAFSHLTVLRRLAFGSNAGLPTYRKCRDSIQNIVFGGSAKFLADGDYPDDPPASALSQATDEAMKKLESFAKAHCEKGGCRSKDALCVPVIVDQLVLPGVSVLPLKAGLKVKENDGTPCWATATVIATIEC